MTLDAPEAHTTHVLLEMVAKILGRISELTANEVPGALLDAAVTDGPFDFGALYTPGISGALEYQRGRGFPDELGPSVRQAFGAMASLEECRESGKPLVLDSVDTESSGNPGLEEALGAESALVIPLLDRPKDCPVLLLAAILHDVSGTGEGLCGSLQAIYRFARTRQLQLQRSLSVTRRWDGLVRAVSEPLLFTDSAGVISEANPAATELFGGDKLVGRTLGDLLPGLDARSVDWSGTAKLNDGDEPVQVRTAGLPKDETGQELFVHTVRRALRPPPLTPRIDVQGPLDSSTGLPDRDTFQGDLEREMELARKYNGWCSVLVIDLDGLSALRQERGEEAIAVLRNIGQALEARLRRSDRLGRLGGDGFGVLLSRGTRDQALALGTSLLGLVRQRSEAMGHPLTASIGISYHPDDGADADALLETAFGAMMLAKRGGGDSALVWQRDLMRSRGRAASRRPGQSTSQSLRPVTPIPEDDADIIPPPKARLPRVTDSSILRDGQLPPSRNSGARRVPKAAEPTEPPPAPKLARIEDDEDTDIIDEVMDMNNLLIALPEDPSSESEEG